MKVTTAALVFRILIGLVGFMGPAPSAHCDDADQPTKEQLNIQISIMKDQIKALADENKGYRQRAELMDQKVYDAYLDLKRNEFQYYTRLMEVNLGVFHAQRIASYVVLLLVFVVVASGVVFSGFQLWKSVSVAGVQANNDLEISAAKVRVTSSVVGIVVLTISLAFLFIYTREVYTIKSLHPIQPETTSSSKS
jgi:hypothetical protein